MISRRAILGSLGAAIASPPAWAAAPARAPAPSARTGPTRAPGPTLLAESGLSGAAGFALIDLETGETLEAHEPRRPFAPASVAKIVTALYALDALGPERRFATQVRASGGIDGGLARDLALVGGGDPELDTPALAALAQAAAAGLDGATGRFLVDPGPWPVQRAIDLGQPPQASYNPAVAALNLNFNRVRLRWRRGAGGVEAALSTGDGPLDRAVGAIGLSLESASCGCPPFAHEVDEAGEAWRVRESLLRRRGALWLPVRDPARYAGEVFRAEARAAGLALSAPAVERVSGGAAIAEHLSRPAVSIARDMLDFSTNLTAEALGLAASAERGAAPADLAASARAMSDWAARAAGLAPGGPEIDLRNHSGLSAESRLSPAATVALLRAAGMRGATGARLADLLERRDYESLPGSTVFAKTGTLDFARALAGYLVAPSGRAMAFAWCANDLPRRAATRGLQAGESGSRLWRARARALETALLESWAGRFG